MTQNNPSFINYIQSCSCKDQSHTFLTLCVSDFPLIRQMSRVSDCQQWPDMSILICNV